MKKILAAALCFSGALNAADVYSYSVNLTGVSNDRVTVTLTPPALSGGEVDFMFPAMVPGTYEVYNFGRFVSNFKATGKNGAAITVKRIDVNTYRLSPAASVERIEYQVDDTFDRTDLPDTKDNIVFEPGGSNFEEGQDFCINTHCLFGYFRGMTTVPIEIDFTKPSGFYPSTGLTDIRTGETHDLLRAPGYHELVDSPILYARPDTATVKVADTDVLVSCYSPGHLITARYIASTLQTLLYAQRDYLGGQLPVSKYAFLFYFTPKPTLSGSNGALEHSYSSFYVMPEFDSTLLRQQLRDVAAHEFFHIVTPLTIHSHEIGEFDFNNPRMSEHLWLYEGMTEYEAHHAQVKGGLITVDEFLNTMMQKYQNSQEEFNDTMSFTYMSKHVLDKKIHKQYNNVYEKGALICMCLDILLRDETGGRYGTQDLMKDLAGKYGKNRSFNDDSLFKDIERFTSPAIGEFLRRHVAGHEPLPMGDVLGRAGIVFTREVKSSEFTLGNPDLNYNPETARLVVEGTSDLDAFGKQLKYRKGDELATLNGRELRLQELRETVHDYYDHLKEGDKVEIGIYRPKRKKGRYKQMTLHATARKIEVTRRNQITLNTDMSDKQKTTLQAWLGIK